MSGESIRQVLESEQLWSRTGESKVDSPVGRVKAISAQNF
jgi:hypothetical protein